MAYDFSYKIPALVRSQKVISVLDDSNQECFRMERYAKSHLQRMITWFFPHWCFNLKIIDLKTGRVVRSEEETGWTGRPKFRVFEEEGKELARFRTMAGQWIELSTNEGMYELTSQLIEKQTFIRKGDREVALIEFDGRVLPRTNRIFVHGDDLDIQVLLPVIHTFGVALRK
ncbi:tubby C-terminal domain-like protein [Salipaludibacillus daqingensis]|uniref:tubby C-terminal domain-like protein n=1 Tax=Salipaludibacillus daqingensis TaxID=3041001 RepID=UPI002474A4C2|nr:hypothetical protein [Salipaludibacillus daqingensis]